MDVILHIGAHRTGSTTLQAYLRHNNAALQRLGIACWGPERLRGGLAHGLVGAPVALTSMEQARVDRSTGLIRIEMERLARAGLDRLLVSEENMIGTARDNLIRKRLYPHAGERLQRYGAVFGAKCSRIVLHIRSYDTYWSSVMAYALPGGMPMPDEARLDHLVTQPRRWRNVISDVAAAFPLAECVVLPFEAMAGRPEAQLAAITGEPIPMLAEARRWLHPSPGVGALRQVLRDRGDHAAAAALPEGDGRWQPFAPHHVDVLQGQYAEDLAWLAAGADGQATLIDRDILADAGPHPRGGGKERGQHDRRYANRATR